MTRRHLLRRGGQFAAVGALVGTPFSVLARPLAERTAGPVERLYLVMGTTVRFQVYHEDREAAGAAISEATALLQRIHALMSVQEPGSELTAWNRSAGGLDRPLSTLTAAAVGEALRYADATGGRLDPTVGAAVRALEKGYALVRQPDRACAFDAANRTLRKPHPDVHLDLGGTAKGWAVDRAVEVLQRRGLGAGLVNAGGDLRVFGTPPHAKAWHIGIRDPRSPDGLLATLALRDAAVATSGDYEAEGSTLVDPRDLAPVRLRGSVSVVASSCGAADCLSTALSVEPDLGLVPEGTQALLAVERDREFTVERTAGLAVELS